MIGVTDADRARELARTTAKTYAALPNYRNNWIRLGFTESDIDSLSDSFIDATFAWGDVDTIQARIDGVHAESAGATELQRPIGAYPAEDDQEQLLQGVNAALREECGESAFARLTRDTAARVAKLARIRVEDDQLPALAQEFSNILDFIEQLNEVDVEGVEPMVSVTPMRLKRREDGVTDGGMQEKILSNAPDAREGFFAVPKVVE